MGTISTEGFKDAYFAVLPEKLVERRILAGRPEGGTALDPFAGSEATGVAAKRLRRNFVGVEINPDFWKMATDRITSTMQEFQQLEITDKKEPPPHHAHLPKRRGHLHHRSGEHNNRGRRQPNAEYEYKLGSLAYWHEGPSVALIYQASREETIVSVAPVG